MVLFLHRGINIPEPHNSLRRASSSVTFKTWVRFPSAPPREHMSFRDIWNGPSFLNRSEVARRMTARDNAGKREKTGKGDKPPKKHYDEHYRKDWDKDLWE